MGPTRKSRLMAKGVRRSVLSIPAVLGLVYGIAALTSCGARSQTIESTTTFSYGIGNDPAHVSSHTTGPRGQEDTEYRAGRTLVESLPFRAALIHPVDAVFIGVTNFLAESGKVPTPAHAIGASFAETIFRQAVERTPKDGPSGKPGILGREIKPSLIKLYTDLRLDPRDAAWHANEVALVLDLLEEPVHRYSPGAPLPADGLWRYLGGPEPLTKRRILQIAKEQAERLSRTGGADARVAIFYLASHGRLGDDGNRYAMAADSTRDLSTWIRYDEIADLFRGTRDGVPSLSALVLFDTCLESEDPSPTGSSYEPPGGTVVLSAAAPGQYSWHWRESTQVEVLKDVTGQGSLRKDSGRFDASFYASMSVLPVAIATAVREDEVNCARNATNTIGVTTTVNLVQSLVKKIPTLADSAQAGRHQSAQALFSETTRQNVMAESPENHLLFAIPCGKLMPAEEERLSARRLMASSRINEAIRAAQKTR